MAAGAPGTSHQTYIHRRDSIEHSGPPLARPQWIYYHVFLWLDHIRVVSFDHLSGQRRFLGHLSLLQPPQPRPAPSPQCSREVRYQASLELVSKVLKITS